MPKTRESPGDRTITKVEVWKFAPLGPVQPKVGNRLMRQVWTHRTDLAPGPRADPNAQNLPPSPSTSLATIMASLFTIPNEILNEITLYLNPLATSRLLFTCRALSSRLAPAMLSHAASPKHGMHALHWAAERGHRPLLEQLLPVFPVDLPGSDDMTALQFAVRASHGPLVPAHLLAHGANANHVDGLGRTALTHACEATTNHWVAAHQAFGAPRGTEASAEAAVRLLLTHGADPTSCPLMTAITSRLINVARLMLDAGCDPNQTRPNGTPIIVWAVYGGRVDWVELFLEYGADPDSRSSDGTCLLMLAAGSGRLDVVKTLLAHRADVRCVGDDGDTLLVHAISSHHSEVAAYLAGVEGVDLTSWGRAGRAPIHLAAKLSCIPVLRVLLEKGCPLDDVDRHGDTALRIADWMRHVSVVRMLLAAGATGETSFSEEEMYLPGCLSAVVILRKGWRRMVDRVLRVRKCS